MSDAASKWVWAEDEIRQVGKAVMDLVAEHLSDLPDEPVFTPFPAHLAEHYLDTPAPQQGEAMDVILEQLRREIEPYPFGNGHPRWYGWVNSPPAVPSVLVEALAAAMNPSVAGGDHAATFIERQVVNWFKEIFGFPEGGMGLFVSGGSMATLTGLAVARHVKGGGDVRSVGVRGLPKSLRIYTSDQGHSCIRKSVEALGIGSDNLRLIPTDAHLRMSTKALKQAVQEDLEAGYQPVAVVATAGTVNTGAIDPLTEIADLCEQFDLWLHVDGAYGAPAVLTNAYKEALTPLSRAHSLAVDPHKWMYVPVEAGLVLVRDGEAMRGTFSLVPPYLRTSDNAASVSTLPWLSEYGLQQTRGFRALKVWVALKYHGLEGYKAAIEKDNRLAAHLAQKLGAQPSFEVITPHSLSIVCFRYHPEGVSGDDLDDLNRQLLARVQESGRAFLTGTTLRGRFALRACIVNPRATESDINALVATLIEFAGEART